MVELSLFTRPAFSAGISSGLLSYLVLFGTLTVAPFLLEVGHGQTTTKAGLELFLLPLGVGFAAPLAGLLSDQVGARLLTVAGMLVASGSLAGTAIASGSLALVLPLFAVAGLGLGMFTPPNNASIMAAVRGDQTGVASGILNMTRGVGTSLGLALAGLVYTAAAGSGPGTPALARSGYQNAAWMLAGAALLAATVAALRRRPINPIRS
jgi:MFS family permease